MLLDKKKEKNVKSMLLFKLVTILKEVNRQSSGVVRYLEGWGRSGHGTSQQKKAVF